MPQGQYPTVYPGELLDASTIQAFAPLNAYKTVDESVKSSTVLVNDSDLHVALAANGIYFFAMLIVYTGGRQGSSDLKGSFAIPAGATLNYGFNGVSTSVGLTNVGFLKTGTATFTAGTSGAGVPWSIILAGTIFNSTAAGNLQFQWAQNTSSGRATTVKAGSALMAWRLG
jgi:hypothetical protein